MNTVTEDNLNSLSFSESQTDAQLQPLALEWYPSEESASILLQWQELEQELGSHTIMNSAAWVRTWLEHYGDLVPAQFVLGRRDGEIKAIALITDGIDQLDGPFRMRTKHLGTAGEPESSSVCVEYNDILVAETDRDEFCCRLLEEIVRDPTWDEFRLDGFDSSAADRFIHSIESGCCRSSSTSTKHDIHIQQQASRYFDLAVARETSCEPISNLGKSTRKAIRRALNALQPLEMDWAESMEEAESIFADMIRLHQQRWTNVGQPGVYDCTRFVNFHTAMLKQLFAERKVVLFRVRRQDQVIGCVQLFVNDSRLLLYQCGWAESLPNISPGLVVQYLCIEEALSRGFDAYDFLAGEMRYKQSLSTDQQTLSWVSIQRPRWKFKVLTYARTLKRLWRRLFSRTANKSAKSVGN